jgi:hypothetical protein
VSNPVWTFDTEPMPGDYCEFCPTGDPSRHYSWCPTYDGDEIGCESCGSRDRPLSLRRHQQRDPAREWVAVGPERIEAECGNCVLLGRLVRAAVLDAPPERAS